jgi:hypothetical protein
VIDRAKNIMTQEIQHVLEEQLINPEEPTKDEDFINVSPWLMEIKSRKVTRDAKNTMIQQLQHVVELEGFRP